MIKKLQIKFVIINMTMVLIMLLIIFGLIYNFTQRDLESENITMMKAIAAKPFQLGRPNEITNNQRLPFFIIQLGMKGELIFTSGGYYDLSDKVFLQNLIDKSFKKNQEIGVIDEHNLRYCKIKTPIGSILVFSDISSEKMTLQNLLKSFIIIGSISFLIFLGISIFLAKWAVKPVAKAWQQQKQFVADASHELKTPLAVIMTNAELLQSEDYNDSDHKNFLQSISIMTMQMKNLVEKLLLLAKSDNQQTNIKMFLLDLSELVIDESISFEGIFMDKGLKLESYIEPNIKIKGNEALIRQIIDILLDNAQKYSYPDSTTNISLYNIDWKKCCLKISNPGEEISKDDLTNIFQRFYRVDKARNRDGSFGLGLAIAKNAVELHKGKIFAESVNGINTFYVEFYKNI